MRPDAVRIVAMKVVWSLAVIALLDATFSLYQALIPSLFGNLRYGGFHAWLAGAIVRHIPLIGFYIAVSAFLARRWSQWTFGFCVFTGLMTPWALFLGGSITVYPADIGAEVGANAKFLLIPALTIQPALLTGVMLEKVLPRSPRREPVPNA